MCVICNSNISVCVCLCIRYPHVSGHCGAKDSPLPAECCRVSVGLEQKNFCVCAGNTQTSSDTHSNHRETHTHTSSLFEPPAQRAAEFPHQTRFDFIVSTCRLQVHCISTEFTPRKHGGEKGVPFRIQIDTFALGDGGDYTEHLHSASCQIKVFKVLTQS